VKKSNLDEFNGICVGQIVNVVKDSGSRHGVGQEKQVNKILRYDWDLEESRRLNIPMLEIIFKFTDETTAHYSYDRIWSK